MTGNPTRGGAMNITDSLAAALAAIQAELPTVAKGETAEVQTKTGGKYKYSYADLADVSKVILPRLGKHGLAWITRPTLAGDRFVLAYTLRHVSGEEIAGEYPLPDRGTPQEIGSAITYARRYTLCSVTGIAPEADDDDGAAASRRTQRDEWEHARPAAPSPEQVRQSTIANAKRAISQAETREKLDAIGELISARENEGQITRTDATELRRAVVARLDELFPDAANWPSPAIPGGAQ